MVHRFSLRNDLAEIPRATGELAEFAKRGGIDAADTRKLQMALADVLTTTIDYRLPRAARTRSPFRALLEDGTVEVAVDDDGAPYELVDPPSDIDPEERYVSQAGGKIVRPMQMDDVDSATVGGHNRLIMRKRVVA